MKRKQLIFLVFSMIPLFAQAESETGTGAPEVVSVLNWLLSWLPF